MSKDYCITELCETLAVSRSGYYAWQGRPPGQRALKNALLREKLQELFEQNRRVRLRQSHGQMLYPLRARL